MMGKTYLDTVLLTEAVACIWVLQGIFCCCCCCLAAWLPCAAVPVAEPKTEQQHNSKTEQIQKIKVMPIDP